MVDCVGATAPRPRDTITGFKTPELKTPRTQDATIGTETEMDADINIKIMIEPEIETEKDIEIDIQFEILNCRD